MAKQWNDLVAPLRANPEHRANLEEARQEARRHLVAIQLAEVRKAQGIGQQELAERLNLSQGTVSAMENSADPKLSTLIRYADALGASLSVVMTPEGKEPIPITGWDSSVNNTMRAS